MENWNHRLREAYNKKFNSVIEFSKHSGVSKDSIHKYLNNDVNQPRGNTLKLLADSLDVDYLWLKEGIMPDKKTIDMSKPMCVTSLREIYYQLNKSYPDEPPEAKILVLFKIYDQLKDDDHDADPGFVRAFFKYNDLSNLFE